jgi:hydrogenase nickel incorporation protein HypA/HybF
MKWQNRASASANRHLRWYDSLTMHELSVTESILEIALRHGQAAQASRITDLYLVIGQLTSLVDDSIQFYWDMIAQDTLAQGARLHFKRIQTELQCLDCHHRYTPGPEQMACTACAGVRVQVVAGAEFFVDAIEIET